MADNITNQKYTIFAYTMDVILQGLYGFSDTFILMILGLCLVLHIISSKNS